MAIEGRHRGDLEPAPDGDGGNSDGRQHVMVSYRKCHFS
jgi:hypothetical protein